MSGALWTEERIVLLTKLWDGGGSASVIGKQMGITRNMVLGKAYRLKLSPRGVRNGYFYDPIYGGMKRIPKPVKCKSVFKSRERKPRSNIPRPASAPGLRIAYSAITGNPMSARRVLPFQPEMTKNQLREMFAKAMANTAAMEII